MMIGFEGMFVFMFCFSSLFLGNNGENVALTGEIDLTYDRIDEENYRVKIEVNDAGAEWVAVGLHSQSSGNPMFGGKAVIGCPDCVFSESGSVHRIDMSTYGVPDPNTRAETNQDVSNYSVEMINGKLTLTFDASSLGGLSIADNRRLFYGYGVMKSTKLPRKHSLTSDRGYRTDIDFSSAPIVGAGPTGNPTNSPTLNPVTESPTSSPITESPTSSPTVDPTRSPLGEGETASPTKSPSKNPTGSPSVSPTGSPTGSPEASPTKSPTKSPSTSPPGVQSKPVFLDKKGLLSWQVLEDGLVSIELSYPASEGWLGFGLVGAGQIHNMIGSSAIIGSTSTSNSLGKEIGEYDLKGTQPNLLEPVDSENSSLKDAQVSVEDGSLKLRFTAKNINEKQIDIENGNNVIVAFGEDPSIPGMHSKFGIEEIKWGQAITPSPTKKPTTSSAPTPSKNLPIIATQKIEIFKGDGSFTWNVLGKETPGGGRRLEEEEGTLIQGIVEIPQSQGWIAVGIVGPDQSNNMAGTSALIGVSTSSNPLGKQIGEYEISLQAFSGIKPSTAPSTLSGESIEIIDGKMRLTFTAKSIGEKTLQLDGENTIVFAYSPDTSFGVAHQDREAQKIEWFSGAEIDDSKAKMIFAHGMIMIWCFCFMFPLSMLPSVFRSKLSKNALWFNIHRGGQSLACLLVIVSFALGVSQVEEHFDTTHKILGLVLFIIVLLQPILAIAIRKKKQIRKSWEASHFLFAGFLLIGGLANSYLGVQDEAPPIVEPSKIETAETFLYIGTAITGICFLIVAYNRTTICLKPKEEEKKEQQQQNTVEMVDETGIPPPSSNDDEYSLKYDAQANNDKEQTVNLG